MCYNIQKQGCKLPLIRSKKRKKDRERETYREKEVERERDTR